MQPNALNISMNTSLISNETSNVVDAHKNH